MGREFARSHILSRRLRRSEKTQPGESDLFQVGGRCAAGGIATLRPRRLLVPGRTIAYRGHDYPIAQRSEFWDASGRAPWAIAVGDTWYQLGFEATAIDRHAREFLRARNPVAPETPPFLARPRYPVLVLISGIAIRGYPLFVPRGKGAKTFLHPTLGRRVGTERGPMWMFETNGRPASECGTVTAEQTIADVLDLATVWLRSSETPR